MLLGLLLLLLLLLCGRMQKMVLDEEEFYKCSDCSPTKDIQKQRTLKSKLLPNWDYYLMTKGLINSIKVIAMSILLILQTL